MATYDDLINALPRHLRESQQVQMLMETHESEIDMLNDTWQDIFNQMFIQTATWGLKYHEEALGMPQEPEGVPIEDRRLAALLRRRALHVGSGASFVDVLKAITPNITIEEEWSASLIRIRMLVAASDYLREQLEIQVEETVPAHLDYVVQYEGFIVGTSLAGDTL